MPTGYYLLDHPNPNCPQRGDGQYWGYAEMSAAPIWLTVHTSESFADLIDGDMGAENVANYFAGSTVPASYHTLVDSDSTVRCLPVGLDGTTVHTAFHCYQRNTGNIGLSFAMRAAEWPTVPGDWANKILARGADEAALWCKRHKIPPVLITLADVDAGRSGITGHGIIQPVDRSDPGALFPWARFVQMVADRVAGGGQNEGDEMPALLCNMSGSIFGLFSDGVYKALSGPEFAKWNGKVDMVAHTPAEWKTLQSWGRVA